MKLRVGFSTTNSLISKIIRWFTDAPVSHTYIRYYDEFLKDEYVVHADWVGIVILQGEHYNNHNSVIDEYEIEDERLLLSMRKSLKLLGRKYDYWGILNWAWVITFRRWAKMKMKNFVEDPKKMICVDFCIRILNGAQITALPYGTYNPKNLHEWFKEHHEEMGWKRIVK